MTNLAWDRDYYYIPVPYAQKSPRATGWNKKENCISNESDAHKLKGLNIGIALAYSRVVHFDVDHWPTAKTIFNNLGIDLKEFISDAGAVFTSGRDQSISALYSLPDSLDEIPITKAFKTGEIVSFELRCGTGTKSTSCSIIKGKHPRGRDYKFVKGDLRTIEPIPEFLIAYWLDEIHKPKTSKQSACESVIKSFDPSETPRKRAVLIDLLSYIPADCDYVTWRDVVWGILSTGWPSGYDIARNWSESGNWNAEQFHDLVTKFDPSMCGIDGPVSKGKVYYHARLRGYRG